MVVGFIGLGKLGLPVALSIQSFGHHVLGNDNNPEVGRALLERNYSTNERYVNELLAKTSLQLVSLEEIVHEADLIFIAVQTPHSLEYEGVTRLPKSRSDFDYSYLIAVVNELSNLAHSQKKPIDIVVISTCLPGTFTKYIEPLLNDYTTYTYNPFFIAMGTVIDDFKNPEFVLVGSRESSNSKLESLYRTIHDKPIFATDITTAEGIKVFYNTFITTKTVLGNVYGEFAERLGMNVNHIYQALSMATDRIISSKYLRAGMGDGGGCHPRDNIALSYLAKKIGLSRDIFEDLILARENHIEWLADFLINKARGKKITILGKSFKPNSAIETGSSALLLANILLEKGISFRHEEDLETYEDCEVVFIATAHDRYGNINWPYGCLVIDPFDFMPNQTGIEIVRIGRGVC